MLDNRDDPISDAINDLFERLPDTAGQSSMHQLPKIPLSGLGSPLNAPTDQSADDVETAGQTKSGRVFKGRLTQLIETQDGPVWIQGNVVMCGCPDCEAPISVRLWLMIADCWNCQTAIELGYEQRRAVEQLARQIEQPGPITPAPTPRVNYPLPVTDDYAHIQSPELETQQDYSRARLVDILRKSMNTLPAWLVSMLVHLALLLILALILLPNSDIMNSITISTAVNPEDIEGGVRFNYLEDDPLEYDSPLPPKWREIQSELREVRIRADQDARELLIDPDPVTPLPPLEKVKENATSRTGPAYAISSRDPRLRNEIVRREGGTTLTEAAVSRGLKWLASVQNQDGSWSLAKYWNYDDPRNRGDCAATSLALLPFLGAGQTHEHGRYKQTVTRGLKWLIEHQKENGDLRYGIQSEAGMYAHGQASIVLVEALSMTGDERFREPAQKAIDFIQNAQHKHGGWRYRPGQPGDTSVVGWQLMALQSARGSNTGLQVDDSTLKLSDYFLDMVGRSYTSGRYRRVPSGALYRYLPTDGTPRATMTAEAMLCRMYLGWRRDDLRMMYAVNWLLKNALPDEDEMNLYYYYYATQVMHHYGGKAWTTWNKHLRDLLVVKQERGGKYPGSWNPKEYRWGRQGGRIYVTALAVCTLEVYYRHLPIFKQLELD